MARTLRSNHDPFDVHKDEEIEDCVELPLINGDGGNSLESLDFGRTEPHSKSCCLSRKQLIVMIAILLCCGIAVIAFATSFANGANETSWRDRIKSPADFSRCPKSFGDEPVLVVLSMDGLAASFINRTKHISFIAEKGLKAKHLRPSFPSNTFPNHYSIVTGLYPESHGIVDNIFKDENREEEFVVWKKVKFNPKWWGGRPIWEIAQKQNLKVFTNYWPGSEVSINNIRPTRFVNFSMAETVDSRVTTLLSFLQLPKNERPHLILNYFHEPDLAIHSNRIFSPKFEEGLSSADRLVDLFMEGVHQANLLDCVNLIILSDHGATECTESISPMSKLKEKFGDRWNNSIPAMGSYVVNRLDPQPGTSVLEVAEALACDSPDSPYQIYSSETDEPPLRIHYRNGGGRLSPIRNGGGRLSPILLMANISTGLFPSGSTLNCQNHRTIHGWDTIYEAMQAIFVAIGPSFKPKTVVEPFANIELFGLFTDLLAIPPVENNGTTGSLRHLLRNCKVDNSKTDPLLSYESRTPFSESGNLRFESGNPRFEILCENGTETVETCQSQNRLIEISLVASENDVSDFSFLHFGQLGLPDVSGHSQVRLLINRHYAVGFSDYQGVPLWTAFSLNKINEKSTKFVTLDCYAGDPRVLRRKIQSCPSKTGREEEILPVNIYPFDHNSSYGELMLSTNILPMYKSFRDGIWKRFWERVSGWTSPKGPPLGGADPPKGRIQVILGPVFDQLAPFGIKDTPLQFNGTSLATPTHFFVILTKETENRICEEISCFTDVISFVLPNKPVQPKGPCQWDQFWLLTRTATVTDIERLTGMKFFTNLPADEAARLKTRLADKLWDMPHML